MKNTFIEAYSHENFLFKIAFSLLLLAPLALMLGIGMIEIVISSISILFLIHSIIKKDFHWLKEPWVRVFLVLWLYLIVRGFFTIDPALSVTHSISFIRFGLLTLALQHWLLKKSSARQSLIFTLIAALVFSTADGLLQLLTGNDLLGYPLYTFGLFWRISALSGKLSIGAKTMMIVFPATAYLLHQFQKSKNLMLKWGSLLLSLTLVLFIPLTGERNAFLMTLLGLGLFFILDKSIRKTLAILGVMLLITLSVTFQISPAFKERQLTQVKDTIVNTLTLKRTTKYSSDYTSLFKTDLNVFKENPIFGIGRKQFDTYCHHSKSEISVVKKEIGGCITNAQNVYFEWLDEGGLVGFLLFFIIPFLWFKNFYSHRKILLADSIAIAIFIEIALRLWPLASTSSFFFSWTGGPFWLMAGWLLAILTSQARHK